MRQPCAIPVAAPRAPVPSAENPARAKMTGFKLLIAGILKF
jgi:hypothetical protein